MTILNRATGVVFCEIIVGNLEVGEACTVTLEDKEYSNGCQDIVNKIMKHIEENPEEIDANDYLLTVGLPETKDKIKITFKFTGENMDNNAYILLRKGLLAAVLTYVCSNYEGEYDQTRTFLENLCCEAISEYNASNRYK